MMEGSVQVPKSRVPVLADEVALVEVAAVADVADVAAVADEAALADVVALADDATLAGGAAPDEAAALQAASCVSQSATDALMEPEFAALAQALCWTCEGLGSAYQNHCNGLTEQDRWRAAPMLTNVSPLTEKGLSPEDDSTGGGGPPKDPVKV